jgi:hypothetical protein
MVQSLARVFRRPSPILLDVVVLVVVSPKHDAQDSEQDS